jgi:hypothetical protein
MQHDSVFVLLGGAFDVIGTTAWLQSGHQVNAVSSSGAHFPVTKSAEPLSRAKCPF